MLAGLTAQNTAKPQEGSAPSEAEAHIVPGRAFSNWAVALQVA